MNFIMLCIPILFTAYLNIKLQISPIPAKMNQTRMTPVQMKFAQEKEQKEKNRMARLNKLRAKQQQRDADEEKRRIALVEKERGRNGQIKNVRDALNLYCVANRAYLHGDVDVAKQAASLHARNALKILAVDAGIITASDSVEIYVIGCWVIRQEFPKYSNDEVHELCIKRYRRM